MITALRELASMGTYYKSRNCIIVQRCNIDPYSGVGRELRESNLIQCVQMNDGYSTVFISGENIQQWHLTAGAIHE